MFTRFLALLFFAVFALSACGSTPDVEKAWEEMPEDEAEAICNAYRMFGRDVIYDMLTEAAKYSENDFGPEHVDDFMVYIDRDCGDGATN